MYQKGGRGTCRNTQSPVARVVGVTDLWAEVSSGPFGGGGGKEVGKGPPGRVGGGGAWSSRKFGRGLLRKGAPRATSLFPQHKCLKSFLQRFQSAAVWSPPAWHMGTSIVTEYVWACVSSLAKEYAPHNEWLQQVAMQLCDVM